MPSYAQVKASYEEDSKRKRTTRMDDTSQDSSVGEDTTKGVKEANLVDVLSNMICQTCKKRLKSPQGLTTHNNAKHPQFVCQTCNKRLNTSAGLEHHMNAWHKDHAVSIEVKKTSITKKNSKCEIDKVKPGDKATKIKIEIKVEKLYEDEADGNSTDKEYFEILDEKTESFDDDDKLKATIDENCLNETDFNIKPMINETFEPTFEAIREEVIDGPMCRVSSENCGGKFNERKDLKIHELEEHNSSGEILICQSCNKHLKSPHGLATHINAKHLQLSEMEKQICYGWHVCQTCNKHLKTPAGLESHIKAKHKDHAVSIEMKKTKNTTRTSKSKEKTLELSDEATNIKIEIKVEKLYANEIDGNSKDGEYFEIKDEKTDFLENDDKSKAKVVENYTNETGFNSKPQFELEDDARNIKQERNEPMNNETFEPKSEAIKEEASDGPAFRVSSEDCMDQVLVSKPKQGQVLNNNKKDRTEPFVSHCSHKSQCCHIYYCSHIAECSQIVPSAEDANISTSRKRKHQDDTIYLNPKQQKQIIKECVEDFMSPRNLAKKWGCKPDTIRSWVRKAGHKLPDPSLYKSDVLS
eukprot:GFUD01028169.1.p1 GENE.GFUD01028169.1~~GFUD01028169.1.p1  ORF type:complete len:583 (-),score=134.02 GFUD01028169.1:33-1781(-)